MDGWVRVWSSSTGQLLRELAAHQNSALRLAVSPDGLLLATAGEDLKICVWKISDLSKQAEFGITSEVRNVFFADDSQTLIAQESGILTFWSILNQDEVMRWSLRSNLSECVISPDHKTIAVQNDQFVQLLDGSAFSIRDQQ
jgi:WD40 repeat protein